MSQTPSKARPGFFNRKTLAFLLFTLTGLAFVGFFALRVSVLNRIEKTGTARKAIVLYVEPGGIMPARIHLTFFAKDPTLTMEEMGSQFVEEKMYTATLLAVGNTLPREGDELEIRYLPDSPQVVMLDKTLTDYLKQWWIWGFAALGLVLILTGAVLGLRKSRA